MSGYEALSMLGKVTSNLNMQIVTYALLAVSIVVVLGGLKLIRLLNAICGGAVGAVIAITIAGMIGLDGSALLGTVAAGALIFAIISAVVKKVGAFLFSLLGGAIIVLMNVPMEADQILLITAAVAGVILAVVTMIWTEPFYIVASALTGATGIAACIESMIKVDNIYLYLGVFLIVGILGSAIQFMMKSREIGKKEVRQANVIREELSKEREIEEARAIFGLDEDIDEEE